MEGKIDEQTGDINGNAEDSVVEKVDGTGTGGATNDDERMMLRARRRCM